MDYKFPEQLFPHFYLDGPPKLKWNHDYGDRGSYERLLETTHTSFQAGVKGESPHRFQPQHKVNGEIWVPTEPIVTPLISPFKGTKEFCGQPVSPDAFFEHMQYYYVEHCMDAFSVMGQLLGEHFTFTEGQHHKDAANVGNMKYFLRNLNKKSEIQQSFWLNRYHHLLGDIIADIPSSLLAEFLHEELLHQKELEYFQPATTGGALACLPSLACQNEAFLIYPSGEDLGIINFHPMHLDFSKDKPVVNVAENPLFFSVGGSVRQVSVAQVADEAFIGLRSDHFCGAWVLKNMTRPRPEEVVQLKERATSLNVSPHVSGQFVVASESGAAYLWVLEKGLQKIRDEKKNMYFNARSAWRWCEFTGHPHMTVYADKSGAELTDIRSRDCQTLFRIGGTADCKSGERVVLSKYLSQSHTFHHLITTQFSAYLLDERMPCVPVLKWEHMMETPPCFAHALGNGSTSKILLGAQRAQETMLLQYSGGREWACQADGRIQKLYSPSESLKTRLLPHRYHEAKTRLASQAAGLSAVQKDDCLCVLQLTETGDIFYQVLKHFDPTNSESHLSNTKSSMQLHDPLEQDSDFERERYQRMISSDDDEDVSHSSDENGVSTPAEEGVNSKDTLGLESSMSSVKENCALLDKPAIPKMASRQLKLIWTKWLKSLFEYSVENNCYWKQWEIPTSDIMKFKVWRGDKLAQDKLQRLRKDLGGISKNRKLLVHGVTYLPSLELTPVPDGVNTEDWPDDLSQRLSASWIDGWSSWWDDKLGLNENTKIEALRRKRLRAKRAKAKNRLALSSSFTSSVSYHDDHSEWSSATSQYLGSDAESIYNSQSAPEHEDISDQDIPAENTSCSTVSQNTKGYTGPIKTSLKTSKKTIKSSGQDKVIRQSITMDVQLSSQDSAVESNSLLISSSLPSLKEPPPVHPILKKRQQRDYHPSSFGSSQDLGHNDASDALVGLSSRSQPSSFQTASQTSLRTSSQTSQLKKKKSRMGF